MKGFLALLYNYRLLHQIYYFGCNQILLIKKSMLFLNYTVSVALLMYLSHSIKELLGKKGKSFPIHICKFELEKKSSHTIFLMLSIQMF